ncbi:MAG: hypothetical protein E7452_11995 [Ruminococcaceae bacterium]|nr:hypothetical protein [Oscillospiraceae bacterium]
MISAFSVYRLRRLRSYPSRRAPEPPQKRPSCQIPRRRCREYRCRHPAELQGLRLRSLRHQQPDQIPVRQ